MVHSRRHEQAHRVLHFGGPAHCIGHAIVIVDGVLWSDGAVVPTVVEQQLSSLREELLQIRIGRRDDSIVQLVGKGHIAVEIQRMEVPVWILEDQVFEMGRDNRWLPLTSKKDPAVFAARFKTGKDLFARTRVLRPGINLLGGFHLGGCQAFGAVGAFAEQHVRIKVAALGVFQKAVLHSVQRVAGIHHRFMKQR